MAIWGELREGTADEVARILNEVLLELGPVDKLLMGNSTVFHWEALKEMLDMWKMYHLLGRHTG